MLKLSRPKPPHPPPPPPLPPFPPELWRDQWLNLEGRTSRLALWLSDTARIRVVNETMHALRAHEVFTVLDVYVLRQHVGLSEAFGRAAWAKDVAARIGAALELNESRILASQPEDRRSASVPPELLRHILYAPPPQAEAAPPLRHVIYGAPRNPSHGSSKPPSADSSRLRATFRPPLPSPPSPPPPPPPELAWWSHARDADGLPAIPALIVSASEERFVRAAAVVQRLGFVARRTPAVFVNATADCRGTNGHRLAMRGAWQQIVDAQTPMAVFEDDVVPAKKGRSPLPDAILRGKVRAHLEQWTPQNDVVWLGGMGRVGECTRPGEWCSPTTMPYLGYHERLNGAGTWSARKQVDASTRNKVRVAVSFYTDHAKYLTPRGAALMLACTQRCLARAGTGVDALSRALCVDTRWFNGTKRLKDSSQEELRLKAQARRNNCRPPFHFMHPKHPQWDLKCRHPPTEYWETMKIERPELMLRTQEKVFLGFLWQDRSEGSLLMAARTAAIYSHPKGIRGAAHYNRTGDCNLPVNSELEAFIRRDCLHEANLHKSNIERHLEALNISVRDGYIYD